MKGKIFAAVFGLLVLATVAARAVVGTPPVPSNGFGMVDGTWLNGLAGGQNQTYQYGISAAGTTQATATQLPAGVYLIQVDTAAASSGVALPPAVAGSEVYIFNNGLSTMSVYPSITNNVLTGAQDTINKGTSYSGGIAAGAAAIFFSAKNGVWGAK